MGFNSGFKGLIVTKRLFLLWPFKLSLALIYVIYRHVDGILKIKIFLIIESYTYLC